MSVAQVKTNMTAEQLLKAVKQLPFDEYQRFIEKAVRLRAKQKVKKLSRVEEDLLRKIEEGTPTDLLKRSKKLRNKRRNETITEAELEELSEIIDELERLNVIRVESLIKLAKIRKKSLEDLMKELGIKSPGYL
jgi:hypothetical protein